MATQQEMIQEHKKTMQEGMRALNERDMQSFKRIHKPDVVVHDFAGPDVKGIDAVVDHEMKMMDEMQIRSLELEEVLAEGNLLAARWTADPIQEGQRVRFVMIGMFRFEDGLVKEVWVQGNPAQ